MFPSVCKHGVNPNAQQCHLCGLEKRICDLENKFDYWFDNGIKRIVKLENSNQSKIPHRCPICDGLGKATLFVHGTCLVCEGKGIVWG